MPIAILVESFFISELKQLKKIGRGRVLSCNHKGEKEEPQAKQSDSCYHILKWEGEGKARPRLSSRSLIGPYVTQLVKLVRE